MITITIINNGHAMWPVMKLNAEALSTTYNIVCIPLTTVGTFMAHQVEVVINYQLAIIVMTCFTVS